MEEKSQKEDLLIEEIVETLQEIHELAPVEDAYDRDKVREIADRLSQKYVKSVRAGA